MAKDFTTNLMAAVTQATQDTQEEPKTRKPRKTYTRKQTDQLLENMTTRGRKGVKLPRINVALRPDLLEYLKTISQSCGLDMTQYINLLLEADKKKNEALVRKVKSNRKMIFAASILNGEDKE